MDQPHITVMNTIEAQSSGAGDIANRYSVDSGPLAMPKHIAIGKLTWDKQKIENYQDQVGEYDIWLEDQIKAQNPDVLIALDEIFNKSIGAGVIITTICMPSPFVTHAHMVKGVILKLAEGLEPEVEPGDATQSG